MEYKFKAWVKPVTEDGEVIYTGCMVDVWEIDFKRRKIIYFEPFDILPMVGKKEELSFDEIELLPYIGLNDINGKEIYKGDILKFTHEREDFKNENAKIVVEIPKIYSVMSNPYNHSFEIIGSVYTNPELLE